MADDLIERAAYAIYLVGRDWCESNDEWASMPDYGRDVSRDKARAAFSVFSEARDEEIRLLREALAKANDQAEHFEREWYLREDAIEAAYREGHAQGRSYWYRADFPQPDSDWLNSKARAALTPPTA